MNKGKRLRVDVNSAAKSRLWLAGIILLAFLGLGGHPNGHASAGIVDLQTTSVNPDILPTPPRTFAESKRIARKIYAKHPVTFYCQCGFTQFGRIQSNTCSYSPTQFTPRTYRLEWEHIVVFQDT